MQYHASSLVDNNLDVDVVGYRGTPVIDSLKDAEANGRLKLWLIEQPVKLDSSRSGSKLWYALQAGIRILKQLWKLSHVMLWSLDSPDVILAQNPPAIPTLLLVSMVSRLRASKLIIDWHNFAYSIMALQMGTRSLVVRLAEVYEKLVGRFAGHVNLTVTEAMKAFLEQNMGVVGQVVTVYDRPPTTFHRLSSSEIREFLERLELPPPLNKSSAPAKLSLDPDDNSRSALIVSSTSWTEDEDFAILLMALKEYDVKAASGAARLEVVVTGKGPQKKFYENQISELKLKRVNIRTAWLEPSDYPLLLGSADLGISLHSSSSGLDLPMKVVDMFGSGLPVAALRYPVLEGEMVKSGNGVLFDSHGKLADFLMVSLFFLWWPMAILIYRVTGPIRLIPKRHRETGLDEIEHSWRIQDGLGDEMGRQLEKDRASSLLVLAFLSVYHL
jgi:beta-1,4-mannosyltransferase